MKKMIMILVFFSAKIFGQKVEIVPFYIPFSVVDTAMQFSNSIDIGGKKSTDDITKFLRSVGLGPGHPYCQAFVYFCMSANEITKFRTGLANGYYTNLKNKYGAEIREVENKQGLIYWRRAGTNSGHAGIIVNKMPCGFVRTIEGNTSSPDRLYAGKRGVFVKVRPVGKISDMELRGVVQGVPDNQGILNQVQNDRKEIQNDTIFCRPEFISGTSNIADESKRSLWEYAWLLLFAVVLKKLKE